MKTVLRWQVGTFVAVLALLLGGGLWFYQVRERRAQHDVEEALETITRLKVDQIVQWRAERKADAEVLAESPFFIQGVAQWLKDPRPATAEPILERFRALQKHYRYDDLLLVDPAGQVLLSLTNRTGRVYEDATRAITAAIAGRRCVLTDLHSVPGDLPPHVDVIASLMAQDGPEAKPIGALVLQCNAREFLYPLIQSWPTPSRSAETLLVRLDGDSVLFLNDLRYQQDAALRLRIPLARKDVPAVMAVEGRQGIVTGRDYRGVEVLSSLMAVPDSPWFMVAKVDSAEALSVWRDQSILIVALILGSVMIAAAAAAVAWQRNAKIHFRALFHSEEARRRSEERYQTTLMSLGDAVIATDAAGRVELLNPVAQRLTGWPQGEAKGTPIEEVFRIVNEETRAPVDGPVDRVLREGVIVGLANHTLLLSRDGTERAIADSGAPIRDAEGRTTGAVLVFRDITESRQLEEEREATIQMLRLLNARNSLRELMQNATSFLRARMGCEAVGIRLREGDDFPYFEARGFPSEFIQAENRLCVTDLEGKCQRDKIGNPVLACMCGNVLCGRFDPAKPFFTPNGSFWTNCSTELLATTTADDRRGHTRNRCNAAGYESVALVPLRTEGQTLGLLQLNDRRKGRFTPQSIALLERLADSLAIALAQRRAAAALRESEERNRTTLYSIGDAVITTDTAASVRQMNEPAETMTGWRQEEAVGKPIAEVFRIVNEETRAQVENPVHRVLREGKIVALANHPVLVSRNGTEHPIADSGAPIRGPDGTVLGVVLVFQDQTRERQRQKELRESEEKFRAIASHTPDHILMQDRDLRYHLVVNPQLDLTEADMLGKTDQDFLAKEDAEKLSAIKRKVLETGESLRLETSLLNARGQTEFFEGSYIPRLDSAGKADGLIGYFRNVTDRKLMEEALRESEERLRSLYASMTEGVALHELVYDTSGQPVDYVLLDVNPAYESILGLRRAAVVGQRASVVYATNEAPFLKSYADVVATGRPMRFETAYAPMKRVFDISVFSTTKGRFATVFEDITAQRQAEMALREASQLNQQVIASVQEGVIVYDTDLRYKVWNPYMAELTGVPAKDVLGKRPSEVFPFLCEAGVIDRLERALTGENPPSIDFPFRISQTERRGWTSDTSVPLRDVDGKIIGVIATIRDITEHKKAEVAIAEEVTRRRTLFEQSPDGIVILDPATGRVLEFNTAAHKQLGYSREEFARLTLADIDAVETPAGTRERIAGVLRGGRGDFETLHRTRQGEIRNVLVTAQSIDVMGHPVYQTIWRDITEPKRLQEQLIQSQKMEAIGQLAGGIAHDFRNQLTVIMGFGEMLLRRSLVKEEGIDKLQQVLKAADRSALLTGHLLAFSRKQTLQPERVDLTELLADIGKAIPRLTGEDVRVFLNPCPTPCVAMIDAGQFHQAIINLVTNGRDAMPKGGDLTIATSRRELDNAFLNRHPDAKPGMYVGVAVTDTGSGMDEATLARIFEPFFTTKEVGQGTGLGLPMVYGFVTQSGGFVEVESQPGRGSTFTLLFPEYNGHDDSPEEGGDARDALPGGTETILVVEDEEFVREMLVESLRESGYTVLHADNAAQAAAELERAGDKIDMLISDVVMPGASGLDLAQTIRKARPEMPVLFVSGYAEKDLKKRGVTIDAGHLLAKPCSHEALLIKVRQLLDG